MPYVPGQIIVKFKKPVADALQNQTKPNISPSEFKLTKQLDKLNRKHHAKSIKPVFKNFRKNNQRIESLRSKNIYQLNSKDRRLLRRLKRSPKNARVPELDRIYKIDFGTDKKQSILQILGEYKSDPEVEYAELNYRVSICVEPNDPLYPLQWSLNNIAQAYPYAGFTPPPRSLDSDIDAPLAWNKTVGSSDIVVAVLDTGVNYAHRDLAGNIWINQAEDDGLEGVDDDGNGYVDDIYGYNFIDSGPDPNDNHGHGTHCAGTIAARGNNGLDVCGVSWNAKIMALNFLGRFGRGLIDDAAEGIYYATNNGADVISNSWGSEYNSQLIVDSIDYAHSQGVIMVAASGNSNTSIPHYPAFYDHMIAVASTDSNDDKSSFSNYGDWVDIAAPGSNILSLRAHKSNLGTAYDQYTSVLSGTSMACPHVSGACALLLAIDPDITSEEIYAILTVTADPIAPGICSSGRLNLYGAVLRALGPQGNIWLNDSAYSCSDVVQVKLFDTDLSGEGSQAISLSVDSGDIETLSLTESNEAEGIFTSQILTDSGPFSVQDETLQFSDNETITATYIDTNDGSGSTNIPSDTAETDCRSPQILNLSVDPIGPEPKVFFQTDEPTFARVIYSQAQNDSNYHIETDVIMDVNHTIVLTHIRPYTDYLFVVEAVDAQDHKSIDDNSGNRYAFRTNGPGDIHVPADYETIQQAIVKAWDQSIVWVADGVYTGDGNRDIDFLARAITVRSVSGPNNCIIDCQGNELEHHRAFYFWRGETSQSVLQGFTITNCYAEQASAIYCYRTSPTIRNCTIRGNIVSGNGGSILYCNGLIENCTISGNIGSGLRSCDGHINNCTIVGNLASLGSGMIYCNGVITNCIIWNNMPGDDVLYNCSIPLYSCLQQDDSGTGCISVDPCFVIPGHWDNNDTPNEPNDDTWIEGDYHLLANSDCVDAGMYEYCMRLPNTDHDGLTRLAGGQIDMGAFEYGAAFDNDGDWLSDSLEAAYMTDPCEPDTDGDGILDGIEILAGTNSTIPEPLRQWNIPQMQENIQRTLFFSRSGETISVGPGAYRENLFIGGRNIILKSIDPCDPNVVADTKLIGDTDNDANTPNGRVITFAGTEQSDCMLLGLTITQGYDKNGGGIKGFGTQASINRCNISHNNAIIGGGVDDFGGPITNCIIGPGNKALLGGGASRCSDVIYNCLINANEDGAIYFCSADITNCIIRDNKGTFFGSAIGGTEGRIENCLISGNISENSGAVFLHFGTINGCTIVGNKNISGNYFSVFIFGNISNSIIWDNWPDHAVPLGVFVNPTYSCIQNYTGNEPGNITIDPCFVQAGYWADANDPNIHIAPENPQAVWNHGDYHLLDISPCIDSGDPNYISGPNQTDFDGQVRVFGERIDMGADEFVPPLEVPMKFTPRVLKLTSNGNWLKAHFYFTDMSITQKINTEIPIVIEPLGIKSDHINILTEQNGRIVATAMFKRDDFCVSRSSLPVDITVRGFFTDGRSFYANSSITIMNKHYAQLAMFATYWLRRDCNLPDWCDYFDRNRDNIVNFVDFATLPACSVEITTEQPSVTVE